MKFHCVNDGVPPETIDLLRGSCEERGIEFVEVDARSFDYADDRQLPGGDLLYRPAVSLAALHVEQFLYNAGVATFYAGPDSIFFDPSNAPLLFRRAGIPIPRTVYCSTSERALLRSYVETLGGFPIVMKMPGFSGGIGTVRIDSFPALFSLLDYTLSQGNHPLLCAYIDQAVHWRLIVIGGRVVTAYRNAAEPDDFRTHVEEDASYFNAPVKPEMAEMAVRAVQVLHTEFGGVDILEDSSGSFHLLESNFPCYFAHPQQAVGVDISGMMIDHLLAKAKRMETVAAEPLANIQLRRIMS